MIDSIRVGRARNAIVPDSGSVDEAIEFVWEFGTTPDFGRSQMLDCLDTVFSSSVRAVERHDRGVLGRLSDRLGGLAGRLLRDLDPSPALFFAVYTRALSDVMHALSANDDALLVVHASVGRRKHILPLLAALNRSSGPMTASQLADRLSLRPTSFTPVLRSAVEAGVVSCAVAGRQKLCSITPLGQSYLDELSQPVTRLVSQRLVEQYWLLAMHTPDEAARKAVSDANPSIPEDELDKLLIAARRVDGSQVAVRDARERFVPNSRWRVVFQNQATSMKVVKKKLAKRDIRATVLENCEEHLKFRCDTDEYGFREFELPYRLLFKNQVVVRRPQTREEVRALQPAELDAIVKSMQESTSQTGCAI